MKIEPRTNHNLHFTKKAYLDFLIEFQAEKLRGIAYFMPSEKATAEDIEEAVWRAAAGADYGIMRGHRSTGTGESKMFFAKCNGDEEKIELFMKVA